MSAEASSLGRNSLIMASGTAASRITGQLRTILLAAAMGTTGIAANAYQAGSMIPQVIFTLVSGGIFNAVLVPQIVRTLKHEDAERRLNALISFAIVLLGVVTVVMMAATPLLSRIYVNGSESMIALTNAFTLWCMPQIFFYGLYTVLGQILAAKNHFATYAWSSVGANVISCVGFIAFIALFGHTNEESMAFWTADKVALTAGAWTIGVGFQALILFVPLIHIGVRYRWHWDIHGIGLRSMGPVAAWSLLIVVIDQIANVLCTRMTTAAPHVAEQTMHMNQLDVAGNATYQNAYTIYMLPYSLIAVSVATAVFPLISNAVAEKNIQEARTQLSQSLRNVGVLMFFFTAAFLVMPLPITRALLPSVPVPQALLITGPLMALALALPMASAYLIIQRTFYAFEDGRSPFLFMALNLTIQLSTMYIGRALLPPTHWVTVLGLSGSIGYILSFIPLVFMLRRRFEGNLDGRRIMLTYGKALLAMAASIVVGLSLTRPIYALLGIHIADGKGTMGWFKAIFACCLFGIVMLVVYVAMLWVMRCDEMMGVASMLMRRLGLAKNAPASTAEINDQIEEEGELNGTQQQVPDMPVLLTEPLEPVENNENEDDSTRGTSATTGSLDSRISTEQHEPNSDARSPRTFGRSEETMTPHLGDTVLNRYTLVSPLREEPGLIVWKASDRVLSQDCQLFIVSNATVLPATNAIAGFLARTRDPRFTPVLQLQHADRIAVVVTQLDPGISISEYVRKADAPLSYEGMRTIIAETGNALRYLHRQGLNHTGISTDTVRLTRNGVQIADAPVSSALADTSGSLPGITPEQLSVNQLADVLYGMLTREPSVPGAERSLDKLPADCPDEFVAICKRGLNLSDDGTPTVPLLTLAELTLLLGTHKPWHALTRTDLRVASRDGVGSIVCASLKPAQLSELIALPDNLASSKPLPKLDFGATPLPDPAEIAARKQAQQKAAAASADNSFRSLWATSKAIMGGARGTDDTSDDVQPQDATEMFSAFDEDAPESFAPMQQANLTTPMDVSALRHGNKNTSGNGLAALANNTGNFHVINNENNVEITGQNNLIPDELKSNNIEQTRTISSAGIDVNTANAQKPRSSASNSAVNRGLTMADVAGGAPTALPPSFAPKSRMKSADLDAPKPTEDRQKKRRRNILIAVAAIVLVAILGLTIRALATGTSPFNSTGGGSNPWPTWNSNDVPFGSRSGADVPTPPEPQQTQSPQPSQSAEPENTTAYPVASQRFLDRPNGQQGYGYYLKLDGSHKVSKVVITIKSSGGHGQLIVNSPGNPTQGQHVADFTFADGGTTEVKLDKPVDTQEVMLWVPIDSLPGGQLYIESMKVF
ncbi:MviN-like protein [Bifidobacterium dolichotidis]|uniref:MviN-like protein n=1 Tax=Bifidobacterium dolichotidis TaxID=2306976 RepID=A0A430FNX5_9BIFI|nr:murein biosynthesis integral membrane protein MurJ [Bifidobacterium dolichotidis]RSX54526.1 MviN-like protein [Bifidobacterium dolichotidis]